MKSILLAFAMAFGVAAAGCGSSGSDDYSCDETTGGTHTCTDYSYTGGSYDTTSAKSACTSAGGTAGTACSHTGAVAGCKITATSGGVTASSTTWYYSGTASTYMTSCSAANGTYETP